MQGKGGFGRSGVIGEAGPVEKGDTEYGEGSKDQQSDDDFFMVCKGAIGTEVDDPDDVPPPHQVTKVFGAFREKQVTCREGDECQYAGPSGIDQTDNGQKVSRDIAIHRFAGQAQIERQCPEGKQCTKIAVVIKGGQGESVAQQYFLCQWPAIAIEMVESPNVIRPTGVPFQDTAIEFDVVGGFLGK